VSSGGPAKIAFSGVRVRTTMSRDIYPSMVRTFGFRPRPVQGDQQIAHFVLSRTIPQRGTNGAKELPLNDYLTLGGPAFHYPVQMNHGPHDSSEHVWPNEPRTCASAAALADSRCRNIVGSVRTAVASFHAAAVWAFDSFMMTAATRSRGLLTSQRFGVRGRRFHPADVLDWIARGAPTRVSWRRRHKFNPRRVCQDPERKRRQRAGVGPRALRKEDAL
jgi:hypothetical protein